MVKMLKMDLKLFLQKLDNMSFGRGVSTSVNGFKTLVPLALEFQNH